MYLIMKCNLKTWHLQALTIQLPPCFHSDFLAHEFNCHIKMHFLTLEQSEFLDQAKKGDGQNVIGSREGNLETFSASCEWCILFSAYRTYGRVFVTNEEFHLHRNINEFDISYNRANSNWYRLKTDIPVLWSLKLTKWVSWKF